MMLYEDICYAKVNKLRRECVEKKRGLRMVMRIKKGIEKGTQEKGIEEEKYKIKLIMRHLLTLFSFTRELYLNSYPE